MPAGIMDGWDQEQEGSVIVQRGSASEHGCLCKALPDDAIHMEWRRHARRAGSECMPRQFYILVSMEIGRDRYITGGGKGIPGWFWMVLDGLVASLIHVCPSDEEAPTCRVYYKDRSLTGPASPVRRLFLTSPLYCNLF